TSHLRLLSLLLSPTFLRREMGNCQAVETATAVLERPDGKSERFYCTVSASEVIKSHPGHHVALLISSSVPNGGSLRVTRIKLLRPSDNLLLGHVYRLISSEEVMKGLRAKKSEKMKKIHGEISRRMNEKQRVIKTGATNKVRAWQPSLQSISESTS
ncbi:hypothetical protein HID58_055077, partial [Brassica napus]